MAYLETQSDDLIRAGSQELDGDKVDIDVTLSNITPDTTPGEVDNAAELGAILVGIDNFLAGPFTPATHAASHIKDGSDEIDGDQLDIDFTPSNYSPSTAPAEATDVDHLAAHLSGIDTALATAGSNDNAWNVTAVNTGTTATIAPSFNADNDTEVAIFRITGATDGDVDLPALSGVTAGNRVLVKLVGAAGSNKVTATPDGTDTIDDASGAKDILLNNNSSVWLVAEDSGNWVVV